MNKNKILFGFMGFVLVQYLFFYLMLKAVEEGW